jgi:hypothetical protein
MLSGRGDEDKWCLKSCAGSGGVVCCCVIPPVGRAGAQTYLGPRTRSGDMMMDGVPGIRAVEGCGRSVFSGRPPIRRVATVRGRELAAGIT